MRIRTLVVDDHTLVRQGMKMLLGQDPELEVVGEAPNGLEALKLVEQLKPQVVLMDLLMPVMDGVTAIGEIKSRFPEVEVIALTSVLEDGSVVAAIKAGAIGYLLKDSQALNVCQSIKAASRGQVQLAPEAAARLMREIRPAPKTDALTDRESEVMRWVARGHTNQEIATGLNIGEKTVKTHVSSILSKLGVKSRTQIAVHAWQSGGEEARPWQS